MDVKTISEKLLQAGESISQAREKIDVEMEGLRNKVVTAVIDATKGRKLNSYGQELRLASEALGKLDTALGALEHTYHLLNGGKPKPKPKTKASAKAKKPTSLPAANNEPRPPVKPRRARGPNTGTGRTMPLVWAEVEKIITGEWQALHQADMARNAGVSVGSVNAALKRFVAEGKIQHQGKEYRRP